MARLPFRPRKPGPPRRPRADTASDATGSLLSETNGGQPASSPAAGSALPSKGDRPLTVTQAAALIKGVLADSIPGRVRVVGEVSNFSDRAHWFFSLKDAGATLRCVCFASNARRVSFAVRDGMEVVASGRLDFFEAQGSLQLYVDRLEPVGQGALELKFRQLCEELRQLGYFDPDRKKPLPPMPTRVAVVTSRSGAALQDVINTAARRWPGCQLMLYDVRVQGAAAAPEIAAAINALSRQGESLGIDAVILTRGGGSIEDLWAFNERVVADAVYRCRLPIVAAIGHETDTTIAELVADVRSATPTQAAMTLIPDRRAMAQQVLALAQRMTLLVRRQVRESGQRLGALARHPIFRRPEALLEPARRQVATLAQRLSAELPRRIAPERARLATLAQRLHTGLHRRVDTARQRTLALSRQLQSLGPHQVLQRGYSYTLGPDGRVLRDAERVRPGDRLTSVLASGRVNSRVTDDATPPPTARPAAPSPDPSPPVRPARRRRPGADEPGLFGDGPTP